MTLITHFVSADLLVYITTCLLFLVYLFNGSKKSAAKMPPGPRPLPFIGNLNIVDLKKPFKSLMALSEKYGDIFTVHFGPKKMVVISGYKAVKEALVTQADDFGERADMPIFALLTKGNGVVFSHGETWKIMRRFTLSTLRDFGMGKKTIESRIQDELYPLIKYFKSHNGKPFDPKIIINSAVSNVICSIIFGKRFEYDDPIFLNLIHIMSENAKLLGTPRLLLYNFYPVLGSLLGAENKVVKNVDTLKSFFSKFVQEHRLEFNANNITGFIDAFLMKQEQESSNSDTQFHDDNLIYSVLDLFAAGTETSSTTLRWGLLLMMKYPKIQKKIQEEIKMYIKPGQLPTVDDRKNMPYTDAVIHEMQRFANIVPLNVSRMTVKDVEFRGFHIPRGTEVIPFLTSVLYDKTQWKTPNKFNPHHFLDANGKFVKHEAFMPFSAGRRACVGESLAKMELFLFFTGLIQRFTFRPPTGISEEDLDLTPDVGFTLTPMPFKFCAVLYMFNGSNKQATRMPPGPKPLPVIGNLNILDLKKPFQSFMELSEKYGDIFTIQFGPKKMVVISGYKAVKEALVTKAHDFGGRADIPIFKLLTQGNGIVFSHGESWKVMRRFTLSTLRDFGMGKKTIENRIQDELDPLLKHYMSYNAKDDDPTFLTLIQLIHANTKMLGTPLLQLYNCYPLLGYLFGAHKKVFKNVELLKNFLRKYIQEHRSEYNTNNITGFIDAFLMKQEQESSNSNTYFHDENLMLSVVDLFAAGTETTSTTLYWGLLLMIKYPEIQKKVQEEIKAHIKPGQMPTIDDRKNMPYTDAVIHEIQRFANIVPLNVSHVTMNDVEFRGFHIPEGTEVIPFLTSVLYDKTQWKTPYKFNPHHFLDENGKFVKHEAFMPFSAGKRACVGESLAKMELFLFFTGLLQRFTVHPPAGITKEDMDLTVDIGFLLNPMPYKLCAIPNY
ncbi:cytochrome P450 2K1-like [Discoglossus pictus]